jgi:hypothetical protein
MTLDSITDEQMDALHNSNHPELQTLWTTLNSVREADHIKTFVLAAKWHHFINILFGQVIFVATYPTYTVAYLTPKADIPDGFGVVPLQK